MSNPAEVEQCLEAGASHQALGVHPVREEVVTHQAPVMEATRLEKLQLHLPQGAEEVAEGFL
jgi:hypothetical protein